ncbi:MAG: DinB family protein [Bryobacteraceae bacterium]
MQTAFFETAQLAWQAERSDALDVLRKSKAEVEITARGLSVPQLTYKPSPDTWSVAEVIEHMLLAESRVQSLFRGLHEAPEGAPDQSMKPPAEVIVAMSTDRSTKHPSPPMLLPTGEVPAGEILAQFSTSRDHTLDIIAALPDLRGRVINHPAFGDLDGYQWVLFVAGHTERHAAQIEEVKAGAGFPRQ